MKKTLLIAMTAIMMASVASAQALKSIRSDKVLSNKPRPAMMQVKNDAPIKAAPQLHSRIVKKDLNIGKKISLSQKAQRSLKATTRVKALSAPRKAGALKESYTGMGTNYFTKTKETWTLTTGVLSDGQTPCLTDVLPLPEDFADLEAISVPYTLEDDEIVIQPTVVAESEDENGKFYVILFSLVDEEGCIRLTIDEEGKLTTNKSDYYAYGAWDQPEYILEENDEGEVDYKGYQGAYSLFTNVQYLTEDEITVPEARYEPAATYFHIGASSSGYGYIANYAVVPPYATIPFKNLTTDFADAWSWRMAQLDYNSDTKEYSEAEVFSASTQDFFINTLPETYSPAQLTASYLTETGAPFSWGMPYEYENKSYDPYIFGGEITSSMIFTDETEATLTRANTKDFGYYYWSSLATPGLSSEDKQFSTVISYQGKPAAPLYIEGVHFGVYKLEATEDFNLKCKIQKMTFDENEKPVLGDVLAESEITYEDIADKIGDNGSFDWTEFYVEDEWGMTKSIDYLFVEDEFAVVIEGWDNGTFNCYSLIDGCEIGNVANTYFKVVGDEEEAIHWYRNNYYHLDLGFYGGWGYLHTEDATDLTYGKDGGTSTIHIDPMLYSVDDETEEPTYSLYIDGIYENEEEVEEVPEWLSVEVANEDYTKDEDGNFVHGIDYDLVFTASALPEGTTERSAQIVFFQTGAKLVVTIKQTGDGVSIVGDLNGDSKVDIADAVTVLNIMAGGTYNPSADLNGDQKVDIADFVTVLNIMAAQ